MKATLTSLKKILFFLILLLMILPVIQQLFDFVELKPLQGSFTKIEDSSFTFQSYLTEEYQIQKEKYINAEFGFRNWFVRVNNQFAFSIYDKAKANGMVIGKENYLYDLGFTEVYFGKKFIGEDRIKNNVEKLKRLKDTLKKKNIDLLIVFALGKASYYPEFIPDRYVINKTISNYQSYSTSIKQSGIPFIDFNDYFVKQKVSTPYSLFPKTGVHWSNYAMVLVADSISHYVSKLRNIDGAKLFIQNVALRDSLSDDDKDGELGCNLLFPIKKEKMGYPELRFEEEGKQKAKALIMGDSFFWGLFSSGISHRLFEKPVFWYYCKEAHSFEEPVKKIDEINVKGEIEKRDVIILLASEGTLDTFPYGFIEKIDSAYFLSDY